MDNKGDLNGLEREIGVLPLVVITIYLAIMDYLVWKVVRLRVEGLAIKCSKNLVLSSSAVLTVFILVVYLEQSNFLERQTKVLKLDKLPMLVIRTSPPPPSSASK